MNPVCALAVCHKDEQRAVLWLRWAIWLSDCEEFLLDREHLVIVVTHRVSQQTVGLMEELCRKARTFFNVTITKPADEDERGYPGSSSHLFVRTLEACAKHHPGRPVLFLEPDTVPTRRSWFHELSDDYSSRAKPVMGVLVRSTVEAVDRFGFAAWHVTGNAIYPADALTRYPSLRDCIRPDVADGPWGKAGHAWDLFCAHELVPDAAETDLIHQIWFGDPWLSENVKRIRPNACLVHRSKDGSLIYVIAEKTEPDFLRTLPPPSSRFMLTGSNGKFKPIEGVVVSFTPCARAISGGLISVFKPETLQAESLMRSFVGKHGLQEISQADYEKLLAQSATFRAR